MRRLGDKAKQEFATRTVMAMATEMADARDSLNRACVQFTALAASVGVVVLFENLPGN